MLQLGQYRPVVPKESQINQTIRTQITSGCMSLRDHVYSPSYILNKNPQTMRLWGQEN